jgi:hypothetical protein
MMKLLETAIFAMRFVEKIIGNALNIHTPHSHLVPHLTLESCLAQLEDMEKKYWRRFHCQKAENFRTTDRGIEGIVRDALRPSYTVYYAPSRPVVVPQAESAALHRHAQVRSKKGNISKMKCLRVLCMSNEHYIRQDMAAQRHSESCEVRHKVNSPAASRRQEASVETIMNSRLTASAYSEAQRNTAPSISSESFWDAIKTFESRKNLELSHRERREAISLRKSNRHGRHLSHVARLYAMQ